MIKKPPRLCKMVVLALLVLWGLADGPGLVTSKVVANTQQSFRDAKAAQDADRRATEVQRQQILASTAAKFDERDRTSSNNDNYSGNRRYGNTASSRRYGNTASSRRYGNTASSRRYGNTASGNNRQYGNTANNQYGNTASNQYGNTANNQYSNTASNRQFGNTYQNQ